MNIGLTVSMIVAARQYPLSEHFRVTA